MATLFVATVETGTTFPQNVSLRKKGLTKTCIQNRLRLWQCFACVTWRSLCAPSDELEGLQDKADSTLVEEKVLKGEDASFEKTIILEKLFCFQWKMQHRYALTLHLKKTVLFQMKMFFLVLLKEKKKIWQLKHPLVVVTLSLRIKMRSLSKMCMSLKLVISYSLSWQHSAVIEVATHLVGSNNYKLNENIFLADSICSWLECMTSKKKLALSELEMKKMPTCTNGERRKWWLCNWVAPWLICTSLLLNVFQGFGMDFLHLFCPLQMVGRFLTKDSLWQWGRVTHHFLLVESSRTRTDIWVELTWFQRMRLLIFHFRPIKLKQLILCTHFLTLCAPKAEWQTNIVL